MSSLYRHIAIEGNIGTGKTTQAKLLAEAFDAPLILESFENNPFLDQFYRSGKDIVFQLEMFFLAERYHQMSRHLLGDIFSEHIIADYFFSKSAIFGGINLDQAERELFMNLYRIMERFMPVPDIVIFLHNNIDTLQKQIKSRGRANEQAIPAGYLESVSKAYFEFFHTEIRMPVIIVDLSQYADLKPEETLEIIQVILSKEWPRGMQHWKGAGKNVL